MSTQHGIWKTARDYRLHLWILALGLFWFLYDTLPDALNRPEERVDYRGHASCATMYFHQIRRGDPPTVVSKACNYPPALYLLFKPLLNRPNHQRALIWNVLVLICTLSCVAVPLVILWRMKPFRDAMPLITALVGVLLVLAEPFRWSMISANPSAIIGALLMAALWGLLRDTPPGAAVAGVALGFGAVIKIFPLFQAIYLVAVGGARRRWWMLAAGALACVAFCLSQLIPGALPYLRFVASWELSTRPFLSMGSNNSFLVLLHLVGLDIPPGVLLALLGIPLVIHLVLRPRDLFVEYATVLVLPLLTFPVVWSQTYLIIVFPLLYVAAVEIEGLLGARGGIETRIERTGRRLRELGVLYCAIIFANAEYYVLFGSGLATLGAAIAGCMGLVLIALLLTRSSPGVGGGVQK